MTKDVWEKQIGGKHYKKMNIQPLEFVNKNRMLFAEGNVIKYVCRHPHKDGKQDILKAIHYCEMIIERDYNIGEHPMDKKNYWGILKK